MSEVRTATVRLAVGGRKVELQFEVPTGPAHPIDLLPLFRSITDTLVDVAADDVEAEGKTVSCRKGCGACCRQIVPISRTEADSIQRLVDALPPARRQTIVERFEKALRTLQAADLLETLRAPEAVTRERITALGLAYFALQIPCPFLEEESCSIHAERPLACREYLVTSRAVHCANPTPESIRVVPMPVKVSRALRKVEAAAMQRPAGWVPMILALECARPSSDQDVVPPAGTATIVSLFEHLSGTRIAEAEEVLPVAVPDA